MRLPLWLGPYLQAEQFFRFSYSGQWVDDVRGGTHSQSKKAYETGVRLSTNLQRTYEVLWGGATRLKHSIWPVLTYSYRADQDEDKASPWFEPIEEKGDVHRVAFSLENFLNARLENEAGKVSYRQWANFNITQGYNINEARRDGSAGGKKKPFEPLTAILVLKPLTSIDFLGTVEWDHYDR